MYVLVFYLHNCLCTMCVPGAWGSQKRASDLPESGKWVQGTELLSSERAGRALNNWALSLCKGHVQVTCFLKLPFFSFPSSLPPGKHTYAYFSYLLPFSLPSPYQNQPTNQPDRQTDRQTEVGEDSTVKTKKKEAKCLVAGGWCRTVQEPANSVEQDTS